MSEERQRKREKPKRDGQKPQQEDHEAAPRKRSEFERFAVVMLAAIAVLLGGYLWVDSQRRPVEEPIVEEPAPEPQPPAPPW